MNPLPEGVVGSPTPQVTVVHDLLPLTFPEEYPRQRPTSPFGRKELVARGLARVASFSWEQTARQVLAVLDQVAGVPGARV